ncbi:MAG: hypothetical protein KDH19_08705 [Geminicoccaceae bacterium]|nr:hypothetical protein [Geminicoccaceae bacterium]
MQLDRISANIDGLYRKYQSRKSREGERFESPEAVAVRAFVTEILENAHIAIEASSTSAVLVARVGDREQAVVI